MFRVVCGSKPRVCAGLNAGPGWAGLLEELPGIDSHSHNDKIGSVLIRYDTARLNADDILYHLY